jgi:hypothetical protein
MLEGCECKAGAAQRKSNVRDEFFQQFIEVFGEACTRKAAPHSRVEKYRSKLPEALLRYWQEEGWASYAHGLFWTVDPDAYKEALDRMLQGTEFAETDNYHVIARSAFGSLYAWGERYQRTITVSSLAGGVVALKNQLRKRDPNPDTAVGVLFGTAIPQYFDFKDRAGVPLFSGH